MGIFGKGERAAFRIGSLLGDANAIASGNPKKIERHWIRKFIYKLFGSLMRRIF